MSTKLIDLAQQAYWETARLVDGHNGTDIHKIPWMGGILDNRGYVRLEEAKCEDGVKRQVLTTHPKWVGNGTIKGWFPGVMLPKDSLFEASVGLKHGSEASDGVTFMVYEHHYENNTEVWNRIARVKKYYDKSVVKICADLKHLEGKNLRIELRVDSGASPHMDQAVWIDPQIVQKSNIEGTMPVTIHLKRFICANPDEDSGKDEPYLMPIAIFADGTTIKIMDLNNACVRTYSSAKVHNNLPQGLKKNKVVEIPVETGKYHVNMKPIEAIGTTLGKQMALCGIVVIALEEDSTPYDVAKKGRDVLKVELEKKLNELIRKLKQPDTASINEMISSIKTKVIEAMKKKTLDSISGIFSLVDPDDFVGSSYLMWKYDEIQKAGGKGISFTMEFKGDGVRYKIEGVVQND